MDYIIAIITWLSIFYVVRTFRQILRDYKNFKDEYIESDDDVIVVDYPDDYIFIDDKSPED